MWARDKCKQTQIVHPFDLSKELVLKTMTRMWDEISLGFRPLDPQNTLLINDCPYKCIGNVPFSYILPLTYDSKMEDNNYLLGILWPYLLELLEAPNTSRYVGCNPNGQRCITRQNPNWKAISSLPWSAIAVGDWYVCDGKELKNLEFPFHAFSF